MAPFERIHVLSFPYVYRQNFFHESMQSELNIVYAQPIRMAARRIAQSWGDFASIHIRGGDGVFRKYLRKKRVIQTIVGRAQTLILNHGIETKEVVLHVATDLPDIQEMHEFKTALDELKASINAPVKVITSHEYKDQAEMLGKDLHIHNAMLFLDQQVAACATIGFTGTTGIDALMNSTFTEMIERLRRYQVCDL